MPSAKPSKKNKKENLPKELSTEEIMKEAEEAEEHFQAEHLQNLDKDELKEILFMLENTDKEKEYEIVKNFYDKKKSPAIEKAKLGHRVWSYYYDNWIFRSIFFLTAPAIFFTVKKLTPDITTKNTVIAIAGYYVLLKLIWRLILAVKESSLSKKSAGSTFIRKKTGIVVLNKNGKPVNTLISFLRGLFRAFPFNLVCLIFMEISKNDRGLHDRIFGTYVLRLNEEVTEEEAASFIKSNYK
ncbi:MAG: RDD family protein [Spirochaetia bacterium]|nr:RDD family protein [Spirochaetia bacterium]